jgi:hypothetical protein
LLFKIEETLDRTTSVDGKNPVPADLEDPGIRITMGLFE